MKCAYEAANGVEGHMVANMLEQHDIAARVDGEHLTSGIGELPAMGLVRVMVNEVDHARAREIIEKWEAQSPPVTESPVPKRGAAPAWFLAGVVATLAATNLWSRTQTTNQGIDFNGDDRLDDVFYYQAGQIVKMEGDANLDGKVDYVYEYDSQGLVDSGRADHDFDGKFEIKQMFTRNLAKSAELDYNMDGRVDEREYYENGVLKSSEMFALDGKLVKRSYFEKGVLDRADYDADGDGILETSYRYDRYGEIAETRRN
ncbi:MAG TPA: DUF2007 domain-containing protein [Steroidobacteraceae bacterium]|nr:DUF2007 domain-containing protein [Steroidobacteraceae bacterium]